MVVDRIANLLASVESHLEVAHERIEHEGTVADASLLLAMSVLLEAVKGIKQDLDSTNKVLFHSAE